MSEERRGRSKYAKKIRRKLGRGEVNHNWMWWVTPRRPEVRTPPHATVRYYYNGHDSWSTVPL